MTIKELISYAKERGFSVSEKDSSFNLQLRKEPNYLVEFDLPKEEVSFSKRTSLRWEVLVKETVPDGKEFREWAEEYDKVDSAAKFDIMKNSYRTFVDKVISYDIRIGERPFISIFGRQFGKIQEIQYMTSSGWQWLSL